MQSSEFHLYSRIDIGTLHWRIRKDFPAFNIRSTWIFNFFMDDEVDKFSVNEETSAQILSFSTCVTRDSIAINVSSSKISDLVSSWKARYKFHWKISRG